MSVTWSTPTQPSDCQDCKEIFLANHLLQAEIRHIAVKYGPGVAESELNERLEERHFEEQHAG